MVRFLTITLTLMFTSLTSTDSVSAGEPVCQWEIIRTLEHDPAAFTQGLDVVGDTIYESTGLYGQSSVRHLALDTGKVQRKIQIDEKYFGEGMVAVDDLLYLLTWREQTGLVLNRQSLEIERTFEYQGEGWGLTFDGDSLIMSNGSSELQFLNPIDAKPVKKLKVMSEHGPVSQLNELEFVDNSIFANVWQTEVIVRIDPENGRVLNWLDMRGLLGPMKLPGVLNGIASLPEPNRLLLTGKNWPSIFEIEVDCG